MQASCFQTCIFSTQSLLWLYLLSGNFSSNFSHTRFIVVLSRLQLVLCNVTRTEAQAQLRASQCLVECCLIRSSSHTATADALQRELQLLQLLQLNERLPIEREEGSSQICVAKCGCVHGLGVISDRVGKCNSAKSDEKIFLFFNSLVFLERLDLFWIWADLGQFGVNQFLEISSVLTQNF